MEKDKYDVGVIGLWYGRNYGSMATYYALHHVLKSFGLSVLMIENCLKPDGEIDITKTHPRKIAERFYNVSKKYRINDLSKLNEYCNTFVVGSDQLWNIDLSRPYGQTYFLEFAGESNKKIAYATSFGKEYHGTEKEKNISAKNLQRFDHISVRDKLSKEICENEFHCSATQVCDPTFLCSMEGYEELISLAKVQEDENYILAYILDPNEETGNLLKKIADEKKCKIVVILDEAPWVWEKNKENLNVAGDSRIDIKYEVDLYEWLWYYKNCKAVITDSFHGTIFSIIFQKPFISKCNQMRGGQRFVSLLEPISLIDRLFYNINDISNNIMLLDNLDYKNTNQKLEEITNNSMEWLKNAIKVPKQLNQTKNIIVNKLNQVVSSNLCTGCGCCRNICPTNAISMIKNQEGF